MDEQDPDLSINVPGGARAEDEPDIEGYDDTQRAEIAEFEGGGRSDGDVMSDMAHDLGGTDLEDGEIEDDADDMDTVLDTDARP